MRIAVLGPRGQLGTDLVRVISRDCPAWKLEEIGRDRLDVEDLDAIPEQLDRASFDVLVNCTSFHKTDEVEGDPLRAMTVNAHAVRLMADAATRNGARFVHFSTDYVFDGLAGVPYEEDTSPAPLNVYGASKLMGEALARVHCTDTLVCRVASLFGVAGASGKGGNFVETMIRVGREKGELRVVDDICMSPTSTHDVAVAVTRLLDTDADAGVYHVVNAGSATWYEFACRIIERVGVAASVLPVPAEEFPTAAERPACSTLSVGRLESVIGAMRPWQEALDDYLIDKGHIPSATGEHRG